MTRSPTTGAGGNIDIARGNWHHRAYARLLVGVPASYRVKPTAPPFAGARCQTVISLFACISSGPPGTVGRGSTRSGGHGCLAARPLPSSAEAEGFCAPVERETTSTCTSSHPVRSRSRTWRAASNRAPPGGFRRTFRTGGSSDGSTAMARSASPPSKTSVSATTSETRKHTTGRLDSFANISGCSSGTAFRMILRMFWTDSGEADVGRGGRGSLPHH